VFYRNNKIVADAVLEKEYVLWNLIWNRRANSYPERTSKSTKYLAKLSPGVKQSMQWQIYTMGSVR
jgi:hypothetical protein